MAAQGDVIQWSQEDFTNPPDSSAWWTNHALICRSVSATAPNSGKDIWSRADNQNGVWSDGIPSWAGISYDHATQEWADEDTSALEEPHTPTGYSVLGGSVSDQQNTNPQYVRIQISASSTTQFVWIESPYYSSGATTHSVGSGIDTASFGGASAVGVTETWTVSNGLNTGGQSYNFYLFDSTPTGTALATLSFPLNTAAHSVLTGTFTTTEGTYYIGYGSGASRVNLAQRTYPARRVPRGNFW